MFSIIKKKIKNLYNKFRHPIIKNITYCNIPSCEEKDSLSEKTVLITGGTSGIGYATAKKVISNGGKAIIVGTNETSLRKAVEELGDNCIPIKEDLTTIDYSVWIQSLENRIGQTINCLVNNAGVYVSKTMGGYSTEDFDRIVALNIRTAYFLMQNFISLCEDQNRPANVVVTTSNRGFMGDVGPYGMFKSDLCNAVQGFARDCVSKGIRVNAVAPGMTASNINHVDPKGNLYIDYAKGHRILVADEIAEVICFLLSDRSVCINGAIIPCDEGDHLR